MGGTKKRDWIGGRPIVVVESVKSSSKAMSPMASILWIRCFPLKAEKNMNE